MGISDEMTIQEVVACLRSDAQKQHMGNSTYSPVHMAAACRILEEMQARIAELEAELAEAKALRDELTDEAHAAELAALAAAIKDASDDR